MSETRAACCMLWVTTTMELSCLSFELQHEVYPTMEPKYEAE